MKKNINTLYWGALALVLSFPASVFADCNATPENSSSGLTFQNPICYDNINDLLDAILKIVAGLASVVAILMFIWAGFQYVTAQGDTEKVTSAHKTLRNTAIGTAILLSAELIAKIIQNTIGAVSGPGLHN